MSVERNRRAEWKRVLVGAAVLLMSGCGVNIARMTRASVYIGRGQPESANSGPADQDAQFARMVRVARARGYATSLLQESRRRFGVRTNYQDRFSGDAGYRVAVECSARGVCTLTPLGPRVEVVRSGFLLPEPMRGEVQELHRHLRRAARSPDR